MNRWNGYHSAAYGMRTTGPRGGRVHYAEDLRITETDTVRRLRAAGYVISRDAWGYLVRRGDIEMRYELLRDLADKEHELLEGEGDDEGENDDRE